MVPTARIRRLILVVLLGTCMGAANQLTNDADEMPANRGIRRNGKRGAIRGRHYTRGRRLTGDDNNVGKRHVVLTADNRQSSWRDARRVTSHMM